MIYADLIAVLNFFVDFLLLIATNHLSGFPPGYRRNLLAALLGGIYGGACMLPRVAFLSSALWRFVFLTLIFLTAFGLNRSAIRRGCVFILLSTALGGIATGLGQGSSATLIGASLLLCILCKFAFSAPIGQQKYIPVTLRWQGKELTVIALKDTGNMLRDPLTGEQVLVAGGDVGMKLLGLTQFQLLHPIETLASCTIPGMRLIPYRAVGQTGGMLLAVRFPDSKIGERQMQPLVAFAPNPLAKGQIYQMLTGGALV